MNCMVAFFLESYAILNPTRIGFAEFSGFEKGLPVLDFIEPIDGQMFHNQMKTGWLGNVSV